jgi:molecular chaperone HscB
VSTTREGERHDQAGDRGQDYFAVFDLPRRLALDGEALQRRFYELSRRHHPDFHQGASQAAQDEALATSALVNRAYRALRAPLARVEHLVALEGGGRPGEAGGARPRPPMDLLEEMMEVQEGLTDARAAGLGPEERARLAESRERLLDRYRAEEAAIIGRFDDWDRADGPARPTLVAWFKERLAARAYLRTVIDDLGEALGEDTDSHVAHRRH